MTDLALSTLGRTGLEVTKLGFGAMELRRAVDDETVGRLLNDVLDAGINFVDTSPDYGESEELIGRHISHRRGEYYLASKCGCAVNPAPLPSGERPPHVYTPENVRAAVEQSLRRMRTDHLDLVQVHMSPSRSELEDNDTVETMQALRDEGKIRFLGMSGTLPNLTDHIAMGAFDAFQIPYSAIEREHEDAIAHASTRGAGVIIRGGVARGVPAAPADALEKLPDPWRSRLQERVDRWQDADVDDLLGDMSAMEFMLRFTLSLPDLDTTIVGTAKPAHLADNLAAARKGPLPAEIYEQAKKRLTPGG